MIPTEFSRSQRLGELIKRQVANIIQHELKDPRFGMITVNFVELSKDLSYADVNVTVYFPNGNEGNILDSLKLLNEAGSFLRLELGRLVKVRKVPQLRFHYDDSLERGEQVTALIDKALRDDRGV